jgi:hypothetical protein
VTASFKGLVDSFQQEALLRINRLSLTCTNAKEVGIKLGKILLQGVGV